MAVIERDMALMITEFFCQDDEYKQQIFFERIAEKLSFERKKEILFEVLKTGYADWWEKYKDLRSELSVVQEFRNKLAHSTIDVSEEALARPLEDGIGFIQWKKGEAITELVFDDLVVKANMASSALTEIKQLLSFRPIRAA